MEIVHIHDQQSIFKEASTPEEATKSPKRKARDVWLSVQPEKTTVVIMNVVHTHDTCPFGCDIVEGDMT